MQLTLPYGTYPQTLNIDDKHIQSIVSATSYQPCATPETLIQQALRTPLNTPPLHKIAQPQHTCVIVIDDYTRPCPNQQLLTPIIHELKTAGVADENITILIATGTHTAPDHQRITQLVGPEAQQRFTIKSNTDEDARFLPIGESSQGNTISINQLYIDADIKILLGDIEYHYFAGYGGTRKSILPGIAQKQTIQENHKKMFHPKSSTGILQGNPISEEMFEALDFAGWSFQLSCVLDTNHTIVGCWSGDPHLVMQKGTALVDHIYQQKLCTMADITIITASGHPHDINLYQATKALYNAVNVTKEEGTIILLASCPDGIGNDIYEQWLTAYPTAKATKQALEDNFIMGGHKAYYHRNAIETRHVILVSDLDASLVQDFLGMHPASTVKEALTQAQQRHGKDTKILIVPEGTTTQLVCEQQ